MATLTQFQIFENPADGKKLYVMHPDGSVGQLEGGGEGGSTTASKVSFSPPEGMSSTNVQQAITENFNNKISNSDKGISNGVASLDSNGKVPFSQLPQEFKAMLTVATYDDLPTTGLYDGMNVFVTDATDDPTVKQGWAIYKYTLSQTLWVKIAEGESLDIVLSWNNITGKPSVFPPDTHNHSISEVTGLENTISDIYDEIDTKSDTGHTHSISDVTNLSASLSNKSDVGHVHTIGNVTGLQDELDDKSDVGHTHTVSNITDIQPVLDSKSNVGHNHIISNVTGLQDALDGKSDDGHGHSISDVTDLQGSLNAKSDIGHTHSEADVSGLVNDLYNINTTLGNKSNVGHGHIISDVSGLQTELDSKSDVGHGHTIDDITDLQDELDSKSDDGHIHSESDITDLTDDLDTINDTLSNKSDVGHGHTIDDVTDLQDELDSKSDVGHTHSYLPLSGGTLTGPLVGTEATFDNITAPITGNADTATKLETARTIGITDADGTNSGTSVTFDGSSNVTMKLPSTIKANITGNVSGSSGSCTGNANTATTASSCVGTFTIKFNSGNSENLSIYTYNGSTDKTINIIPGSNINFTYASNTLTINGENTVYNAGTGIAINNFNITNTGVLTVSESTVNGNISVNTNGTTANVPIHGLGSAAYTNSSTYAEASHTHAIDDVTDLQDELDDKSDVGHTHVWNDITNPPETYTPSDHTHPISDIDDLQDELDSKSDTTHLHDDRYYTETETDTLLNGKSNTGHGHSISDVTNLQDALDDKSDVGHSHTVSDITDFPELADVATSGDYNDLSNTPVIDSTLSTTSSNAVKNSVITSALNGKATSVHTHTISEVTDLQDELDSKSDSTHLHDDRYYTETETDDLLDDKSDVGHTHTVSNITDFPTLATVATSGSYNDLSNKPVVDSSLSTTSTNAIQNSAVATALNGKASSSHTHEISEVTDLQDALDDKSDTTHLHDDRYYTESETDTLLNGKSDTGHTHSISDVTSLQDELDSKSDVSHTHSYLPLSGGTLTGNLEGTNATFDNVTSDVTGNASTSSKWATPRSISISNSDGTNVSTGVDLDGSGNVTLKLPSTIKATITDNPTYGVCSTTGSTVAKIVTLSNFVLYTGARITVKFSYKNTVDYPTLNVNNTGAKNIVAQGENLTAVSTYSWGDNNVIDFVYDGTSWVIPNNAITLGDNVMCITNAVFENETLRFYSPDTIKYNFNIVTAANSITIPINKPMCKIVDPSTLPSTAPTNNITISGTPVEGQMLIISNTSSYDAQGSGIYVPSKEIQKFICIDQGDGTLVWWSIGYGRIMLA